MPTYTLISNHSGIGSVQTENLQTKHQKLDPWRGSGQQLSLKHLKGWYESDTEKGKQMGAANQLKILKLERKISGETFAVYLWSFTGGGTLVFTVWCWQDWWPKFKQHSKIKVVINWNCLNVKFRDTQDVKLWVIWHIPWLFPQFGE